MKYILFFISGFLIFFGGIFTYTLKNKNTLDKIKYLLQYNKMSDKEKIEADDIIKELLSKCWLALGLGISLFIGCMFIK